MKRIIFIILTIILLLTFTIPSYGEILNNFENKYGMELQYGTNPDYDGKISISGLYVYDDDDDYVFTILYNGGKLLTFEDEGIEKVMTSFFNPPSGDIIKISWLENSERITSSQGKVQYRVDKDEIENSEVENITVFFYDVKYGFDNDKNISCYFEVSKDILDEAPLYTDLKLGYQKSQEVSSIKNKKESKYGMELQHRTDPDYEGNIKIKGVYVYYDKSDYIFTVLYSGGKLETLYRNGVEQVKTSFFNPPSGDIIKITSLENSDRITSSQGKVQYRVDKDKAENNEVGSITVFLNESKGDNETIWCNFKISKDILEKSPVF